MVIRIPLFISAIFGLCLTVAGAIGAHAISTDSASGLKSSWDSAMLYGFVHTLATVGAAMLAERARLALYSAWAFLVGVVLFSFNLLASIAAKAGAPTPDVDPLGFLGAITPVGGIAYMLGWVLLAVAALQLRATR